jgi:hypothetical protein
MAAAELELPRSIVVCPRVQCDKTVDLLEEEMDAVVSRLRKGLNEMRHQDQNFNTRLTKMRNNIEEVKSACWPNFLTKTHKSFCSHGQGSPILGSTQEAIELRRRACKRTPDEKLSPPLYLTQDQSVRQALPEERPENESSNQPRHPTIVTKMASESSISVSTKNVPSLHSSPLSCIRQERIVQRRGSLGSQLLRLIKKY